jgi:hypothetical protein
MPSQRDDAVKSADGSESGTPKESRPVLMLSQGCEKNSYAICVERAACQMGVKRNVRSGCMTISA